MKIAEFPVQLHGSISCQYRCGAAKSSSVVYCQCDPECETFHDCCVDYYTACKIASPNTVISNKSIISPTLFSCSKISVYMQTALLVTRCPDDWKHDFLRAKCNYQSQTISSDQTASKHWPVYNRKGYNFRNLFCAICNKQNVFSLEFWSMNYQPATNPDQATTYDFQRHRRESQTSDDTLEYELCQVSDDYVENGNSEKETTITTGKHFRSCILNLIDRCPETHTNSSVEDACKTFALPLCRGEVNEEVTLWQRYKNPYCLLCHDVDSDDYDTCSLTNLHDSSWITKNGFLTVIWKFLDNTTDIPIKQTKLCMKDEVFDIYSGICRPVACAPGFQRKNGGCEMNLNLQSIIESKFCIQENAKIVIAAHGNKPYISECVFTSLGFPTDFYENIHIRHALYYSAHGRLKSSDVSNHSAQDVLNTLKEGLAKKDIVRDLVSSCETRNLEFIHSCRKTHHEVECSGNWFHGSPSDFRRVGNVTNNAEVYLYGTSYITPEFTLCITQFQYSPFLEEFLPLEECYVCGFQVPLLNCPLLTIYEYEYEIVERGSQQTEMWYAKQVFPEGTFLQLGDGRVLICAPVFELFAYTARMGIVNIAGTTMSLIGLAATFATYVSLSELLNTHGKNMLCLTASLFVALLLPLITENVSVYGLPCTVLATISHFAWLSSFCWMTLIASSMAYDFAYKSFSTAVGIAPQKLMSTLHMHLLGWGIPSGIVTICLLFHIVRPTGLTFQYGGLEGVCWILDGISNLIFFGIPVALSVTSNLVLFIWSVIGLCKKKREAKVLIANTIRLTNGIDDAILFLKVGPKLK